MNFYGTYVCPLDIRFLRFLDNIQQTKAIVFLDGEGKRLLQIMTTYKYLNRFCVIEI